jgi:hypothetical protein
MKILSSLFLQKRRRNHSEHKQLPYTDAQIGPEFVMFAYLRKIKRQLVAPTVLASVLVIGLSLINTETSYAQTVDTTPPIIELEELIEGVADLSQVFTVQIAEDGVLKDATLYYRRSGQAPYTRALMEPLGTTGYFSVSIETDPNDLRAIEYYVQARDEAGNRTVSGFAFNPYIRNLTPADPVTQRAQVGSDAENQPASGTTPLLERRWFQIALGVVAVGLAASLLNDDGGEDTQLVPVTINLE